MLSRRLFLFSSLLTLSLSGCMSLPGISKSARTWQGRFSLTATQQGRSEHQSGHYLFAVTSDTQVLDLKTPLGGTIARIETTRQGTTLHAMNQEPVKAKSAYDLMMKTLGFALPVEGLPYWIEGMPVPNEACQTTPSTAPFDVINQDGWTIEVATRHANGAPKRLRIQRAETAFEPALSITLLVSEARHE